MPTFTVKGKEILILHGLMHVHTINSILIIQSHLNVREAISVLVVLNPQPQQVSPLAPPTSTAEMTLGASSIRGTRPVTSTHEVGRLDL